MQELHLLETHIGSIEKGIELINQFYWGLEVVAGRVAVDRIRGPGVAVVEVVLQQEDEVAATLHRCWIQYVKGEDRAEMIGVTAQAGVARCRIYQQERIAVGAIRVDELTVLAVVDRVAAVAVGDALIVEGQSWAAPDGERCDRHRQR